MPSQACSDVALSSQAVESADLARASALPLACSRLARQREAQEGDSSSAARPAPQGAGSMSPCCWRHSAPGRAHVVNERPRGSGEGAVRRFGQLADGDLAAGSELPEHLYLFERLRPVGRVANAEGHGDRVAAPVLEGQRLRRWRPRPPGPSGGSSPATCMAHRVGKLGDGLEALGAGLAPGGGAGAALSGPGRSDGVCHSPRNLVVDAAARRRPAIAPLLGLVWHGPFVGRRAGHRRRCAGDRSASHALLFPRVSAVALAPHLLEPLRERYRGWARRFEEDGIDPIDALVVRLASDGLWMAELLGLAPPVASRRRQGVARLEALAQAKLARRGAARGAR
jgi:hypothetical protein